MARQRHALNAWFQRTVLARRWLCFIVLGVAFAAFGAGTFNLFLILRANVALVLEHGWQALMDGAARQMAEIIVTGYASMVAWIVFRACEQRLVQWLTED